MKRLALVPLLALALLTTGGAQALIDCTCYDVSRVDTLHPPKLVLRNVGVRGWNLFDVSPDRTHVVFSHPDLEIADVDGARPRSVSAYVRNYAEFSPDGRLVAFADGSGISVVRLGGGTVRDFHDGVRGWAAWAPDSKRLVFEVGRSTTSPLGRLAIASVAGGPVRPVTPWRRNLSGGTSLGIKAAWSPDGTRIAYIAGDFPDLHVLRLRDRKDVVIAAGRAPVWSPDSRKLAFLWSDRRVAVINSDGTHVHVLDPEATDPYAFGVEWSPSGRFIAYRRPFVGDDLWIARADGTHRRRLTRGVKNEEIGPIYWSRDGQTILYTHLVQYGE